MQDLSTWIYSRIFICVKPFPIWKLVLLFLLLPHTASFTLGQPNTFNSANSKNDKELAELYMEQALEQYYINTHEAIRYANLALNSFGKTGDTKGIGRCNNILGAAYFSLGEFQRAESFYLKAYKSASAVGDSLYIGKSLNNLGNVNQKFGQLEKAVNYYLRAITTYRNTENPSGEVGVLNNVASVYSSIGNLNSSNEYYLLALALAEQLNDKLVISTIQHNLASNYAEQGKFYDAMEYCSLSYELRKELDYSYGIIKNLIALGNINESLGEISKSRSYLEEALSLARETGYVDDEAAIYLHLGYLEFISDKNQKARQYYLEGLSVADTIQNVELQTEFHKQLYKVDSSDLHFDSAFFHLQKYNELRSLYSENIPVEQLAELQDMYDLVRKESIKKESALQKSKNTTAFLGAGIGVIILLSVIVLQQQRLKSRMKISELSQENLRSQMNPHFIFNVLNSIHAFILSNDKNASSEYLLKFAKLLRLTLDNSQTKLATISDELEALQLYLDIESMRLDNKLEYQILVDDEIDTQMFKIPPLLLQPCVENSIVHGLQPKPEGGKVEIKLDYEDNHIHCSISDNGIGRQQSKVLHEQSGTKRKSYGTKITENRLKLINSFYGKKMGMSFIDLKDEFDNPSGTKVEFNLPIIS